MTAPNATPPDNAYVVGEITAQDETPASVDTAVAGAARTALGSAVSGFGNFRSGQGSTYANIQDGQNALKNRMDLLSRASGHCSAVMGFNWDVPMETQVVVPFDLQLGPHVGSEVDGPNGTIVLKKGGLWRVDAHMTAQGYNAQQAIIPTAYPPYFTVVYYNSPIYPSYFIQVIDPDGDILTGRVFNAVADVALYNDGGVVKNHPHSSAFSHTFVIPDLPPEDSEGAEDTWYRVRVAMLASAYYDQTINDARCNIRGGTKLSSLIASRWSRDVVNQNYLEEAPDSPVTI